MIDYISDGSHIKLNNKIDYKFLLPGTCKKNKKHNLNLNIKY